MRKSGAVAAISSKKKSARKPASYRALTNFPETKSVMVAWYERARRVTRRVPLSLGTG